MLKDLLADVKKFKTSSKLFEAARFGLGFTAKHTRVFCTMPRWTIALVLQAVVFMYLTSRMPQHPKRLSGAP